MPGSSNATPLRQEARTPDWAVAQVQEFIPRATPDQHMVSSRSPSQLYINTILILTLGKRK